MMMLLEATKQGRVFMVKYLLDSGNVNVNETDKQGQTALIKACLLEDHMAATRRKLTRLLLSKGASVTNVDMFGRNVLMWACLLGKIDVVEILLGRALMDLDFNCVDRNGDTALHYVASAGRFRLTTMIAKAMKRFGVSVDKRNNQGVTPFLVATKHGNEECAKMLLDHEASRDILDPETFMNARELAENQNLTTLVELMSTTQSRPTLGFPSAVDVAALMMVKPRSLSAKTTGSVSSAQDSVVSQSSKCDDAVNSLISSLIPNNYYVKHSSFSGSSCKEDRLTLHDVQPESRKRGATFTEMSLKERGQHFPEMSTTQFRKHNSSSKATRGIAAGVTVYSLKSDSMLLPAVLSETDERRSKSVVLKNPYDVYDLKDLLSLYGEQQSSTFRIGFPNPTLTSEQFQVSLRALKSPPDPVPSIYVCGDSRRSSISTMSSSGPQNSGFPRRNSVLLRDGKHPTNTDLSAILRRTKVAQIERRRLSTD